MSGLDEVQAAVRAVADTAGPAVVGIGRGWGLGSGVVVSDGVVLTNAHNVRGGEVTVSFGQGGAAAEGHTVEGQVAGVDVDGDLAVLNVNTAGVTSLTWADTAPELGAVVFGLANPGGRGLRVTVGMVSALGQAFRGPRGRQVTGSVEHTAPLARGSSGGPVVDAGGHFLGLNTNRLGEGFYAAIPADGDLRSRVDALARGESASPRHLGVGLVPGRAARHLRRSVGLPDRDGVLVQVVQDDSPAARAGLRRGDLITEAGGRPVGGVDDLHAIVDGLGDGDSLSLGVVRGADDLSVSVTFTSTREEGSTS